MAQLASYLDPQYRPQKNINTVILLAGETLMLNITKCEIVTPDQVSIPLWLVVQVFSVPLTLTNFLWFGRETLRGPGQAALDTGIIRK